MSGKLEGCSHWFATKNVHSWLLPWVERREEKEEEREERSCIAHLHGVFLFKPCHYPSRSSCKAHLLGGAAEEIHSAFQCRKRFIKPHFLRLWDEIHTSRWFSSLPTGPVAFRGISFVTSARSALFFCDKSVLHHASHVQKYSISAASGDSNEKTWKGTRK